MIINPHDNSFENNRFQGVKPAITIIKNDLEDAVDLKQHRDMMIYNSLRKTNGLNSNNNTISNFRYNNQINIPNNMPNNLYNGANYPNIPYNNLPNSNTYLQNQFIKSPMNLDIGNYPNNTNNNGINQFNNLEFPALPNVKLNPILLPISPQIKPLSFDRKTVIPVSYLGSTNNLEDETKIDINDIIKATDNISQLKPKQIKNSK